MTSTVFIHIDIFLQMQKPSIIFLSTPNNPTGNSFSVDRVVTVIKKAPLQDNEYLLS